MKDYPFSSKQRDKSDMWQSFINKSSILSTVVFIVSMTLSAIAILLFQLSQTAKLLDVKPSVPGGDLSLITGLMIVGVVFLGFILSQMTPMRVLSFVGLFYLCYWYLSQLIEKTYYLNNPEHLVKENFTQYHTLPIVVSIFLLALIFRKLFWSVAISRWHMLSSIATSFIFSIVLINDKRFLELLKPTLVSFLEQEGMLFQLLCQFILPLFVVFSVLCYAFVGSLSALLRNEASISLALFSSFIIAVYLNYYLQLGYRDDGLYNGHVIAPGAMSFQISILTLIFFIVYLVLNRYLLTTIISVLVAFALSFANAMKMTMRAEPLLLTDLVWIKELTFLTGFVEKTLLVQIFLGIGGLCLSYFMLRRYLFRGPVSKSYVLRGTILFSLFLTIIKLTSVLSNEKNFRIDEGIPVLSRLNNDFEIDWLGSTMTARYKSLAFVWLKQLTKPLMEKPDSYSREAVERLYEKYTSEAKTINLTRPNQLTDQTVIFILSESFANPEYVPGVSLSEPAIPNVLAIKERTTSGLMQTQFYGGGTANLEFQSLTGLPFAYFSPSVSIAYTEVVPKMSYLPSISQLFEPENRLAIHPYGADNYNRSQVYHQLAFEKFFAHGSHFDDLIDVQPLGVYASDTSIYNNIIKLLNPEQPQFFSVITMQNHAPWVMLDGEQLAATGEGFSEEQNHQLTAYARLLRHTDEATKNFLEQLSALNQQVTVVFYGDHLPGLYPKEVFERQPESQYQTDYFIWSNKQPDRKLPHSVIGASDFIAQLLEHTGSKVTPYQALLTKHLQGVNEHSGELSAVYDDLALLQYDITAGKGYMTRHKDFFEGK